MKKVFWKKFFMIVLIVLLVFAIGAGAFVGYLAFRPVSEPVLEDINHSSNINLGDKPYEIKVETNKQQDILSALKQIFSNPLFYISEDICYRERCVRDIALKVIAGF